MSVYDEMVPGMWIVKCVDKKQGGCGGPAFVTLDGAWLCENHARARGLIKAPGPVVTIDPRGESAGPREVVEGSTSTPIPGSEGPPVDAVAPVETDRDQSTTPGGP